jgi:hypothetical protein
VDLQTLSNLGLPEWLVIIAALVFIAKQVGLLDFFLARFTDIREHKQATENVAIEVLKEVMREAIHERSEESGEHSKAINELDKSIYRLGIQIDNNTQSIRALAGIISEMKSEKD